MPNRTPRGSLRYRRPGVFGCEVQHPAIRAPGCSRFPVYVIKGCVVLNGIRSGRHGFVAFCGSASGAGRGCRLRNGVVCRTLLRGIRRTAEPGKGLAGAAGFRQNPLQRCGRSPVRPKAGALPSGRTGGGSVRRRSGGVRTFGSGGRGANGRYFPAWRCGYTSFCINFAGLQQREYRYGDIACRQLRLVHLQSGAHAP